MNQRGLVIMAAVVLVGFGIFKFSHREASGSKRLKLTLNNETACGLGVLDALDMDLHYAGSTGRLLLTAESPNLIAAKPALDSRVVSRDELSKTLTVEFDLVNAPEPIEIFLCTDNSNTGNCRNKTHPTLSEIVVTDAREVKKNSAFGSPPDRTFLKEKISARWSTEPVQITLTQHGGKCP